MSGVIHGAVTVLNVAGPPITAAAVLGPVIVIALEWSTAVAHAFRTVMLVAGYWLALGALRVVLEVASRRFDSFSVAADGMLGRSLSRYHHHYRAWVLSRNRYPQPSRPLPTAGAASPELDDIFVDVSVLPRPTHLVTSGVLDDAPASVIDRHSIWHFLNRKRPEALVLLGAPGSGKSTLLRHIARRIASRPPLPGRRWIPVLIELRAYGSLIIADRTISLPGLVSAAMQRLPTPEPPGWWRQKLRKGRCVVLLDGLDEVPHLNDRAAIMDWLRRQATDYRDNHFLITSRPYGYDRLRADEFKTLQARPFTEKQVREFIVKWYSATERLEGHGRAADGRAAAGASDLIERLSAATALHDLMANPLLLTMIANVHRHRKSLPENRVRLYAEVFDVLLGSRSAADPLRTAKSASRIQDELSAIAFAFMQAGALQLHREDMPNRPAAIELGKRNGILVELDQNVFAFAHLTFQEYLTARFVRNNGRLDVLVAGINSTWWRETILLWAAGQSADEIVSACLDSGQVGALSLAVECTDVDAAIRPVLRRRLQAVIDKAYERGADAEHRRIVAGVETLRYVRRSILMPSGSRLCLGPVPARLHWLFRQNDPADLSPAPPADAPVLGIGGRDALELVEWINEVTRDGGDPDVSYRLPAATELDALVQREDDVGASLRRHMPAVWVASRRSELPQIWTVPGAPSPTAITGSQLSAHLSGADASPCLLLDVMSVSLRAQAVLARDLIEEVTETAKKNAAYIALLAARPYVTFRVAGSLAKTEVVHTEPVTGVHPFRDDAAIAHKNLDLVRQVQAAIVELADLIRVKRDVGGEVSIAGIGNVMRADYALTTLRRRCAELGKFADAWRTGTWQSMRDIHKIREQAAELKDRCLFLLQNVEAITSSFRRVRVVSDRSWRVAADRVDRRRWNVAGRDADAQFRAVLRAVIGERLEGARNAIVNRDPDEPDRILRAFHQTLLMQAGLREYDTFDVYIDQVREDLPGLVDRSMTLPDTARPLIEGLRSAASRAFARSGGTIEDCREAAATALGLAACTRPNDDYLSVVAAAVMLEQRTVLAQETVYLASI